MRLFIALLSLIVFASYNVFARDFSEFNTLLPAGTSVSYAIQSNAEIGNTLNYQGDKLRPPASTLKVVTALAAKLYLPKDFKFETSLKGKQTEATLSHTEFVFTGDPSFTRTHLRNMIIELKRKGITKITGDITLNTTSFNGYSRSNGQVWNDLAVCYAAQASALIINGNCVLGNLKRTQGSNKVYIPNYEPIKVSDNVDIVSKDQRNTLFCDLEVSTGENNTYDLFGCITQSKKSLPLSFAVTSPQTYFKAILQAELHNAGITFSGDILKKNKPSDAQLIAQHKSPSLDSLLHTMLKESDNLIADVLFKTLGAIYYQQPGNYRNGSEAVKEILLQQKIDLSAAYIADGSGLSRHNLISANMLYDVLGYIAEHDEELNLISKFPISGIDGTLKYRRDLNKPPIKGNVQAKTGSLKGTSNLIGIVTNINNDKLPFVILVSGYQAPKPTLDNGNRKIVSPLAVYFKSIFTDLITSP